MQAKYIFLGLISSILACTVGLMIYDHYFNSKIGYVKTGEVLQKYSEVIKADKIFEAEKNTALANLDTLKNRFLRMKAIGSTTNIYKQELNIAENEYFDYQKKADEQLNKRKMELTSEAINKFNAFIKNYGERHGYRYVLGATTDGSILFGSPKDDITEDVLKELNK